MRESLTISPPEEGRQTSQTYSGDLLGSDGNAFAVMAETKKLLKDAGASGSYITEYLSQAMQGDYDHLLAVSMAFLDAEPI